MYRASLMLGTYLCCGKLVNMVREDARVLLSHSSVLTHTYSRLSKRELFLKKNQLDDELIHDELELSEKKKKKEQAIKVEEKVKREIYLPEAISVTNLAKVIGLRLGESLKQMFVTRAYYLISHN